jgi:hypothetical protein
MFSSIASREHSILETTLLCCRRLDLNYCAEGLNETIQYVRSKRMRAFLKVAQHEGIEPCLGAIIFNQNTASRSPQRYAGLPHLAFMIPSVRRRGYAVLG